MRKGLIFILIILACANFSGCTATALAPPIPGPLMIPSSVNSVYSIYAASTDERDLQTIIEDEMLETSISSDFLNEKKLSILDLSVFSFNGNIYVVGEYDAKEDFKIIRNIVRNTPKTNSLTTFLFARNEVEGCRYTDNYTLQMAVKNALLNDENVWGAGIAVKSVQCNIILMGRVATAAEAISATRVAANIKGVKSVKAFIRSTRHNKYLRQHERLTKELQKYSPQNAERIPKGKN